MSVSRNPIVIGLTVREALVSIRQQTLRGEPTLVIAHRGASRAAPENTVAAFRLAHRMGADMVELDVRRTADGVLAVHHDALLADGLPLVAHPWAEVPADVPTLTEALGACEGMRVNVEIKNLPGDPDFDDADMVAQALPPILADLGWTGRALVSSFNLRTVDVVRRVDRRVATAWLVVGIPAVAETVERTVAHGHAALHPHDSLVDPALVAACHDAGLAVNVWTVDDPDRMAELAGWGVDGICTNVPDLARAVLAGDLRGGPGGARSAPT